jgi:hypothetical protein
MRRILQLLFGTLPKAASGLGFFVAFVAAGCYLMAAGLSWESLFLSVTMTLMILFACSNRYHIGKAEGIDGAMTHMIGPNWQELR